MKAFLFTVLFINFLSSNLYSQSQPENIYSGKVVQFESKILKEAKRLFVHLPKDYGIKKYPSIYLISSRPNDFRTSIFQDQFVIIGIENINIKKDFIEQDSRNNYLEFLTEELIPFVETEYNTNSVRFISGHSISGGFVMDVFSHYPNLFAFYIATSPTTHVLNLESLDIKPEKPAYLYFNIGSRENYEQLEKANNNLFALLDSLNTKNLNFKYEVLNDETHETNEFSGFCRGYSFYKSFSTIPDSLLSKNINSIVEYVNQLNDQLGNRINIGEYIIMPNILINLQAKNYNNVISAFEYLAENEPGFLADEIDTMIDIAEEVQNYGNNVMAKRIYQILVDQTQNKVAKEKMNELDIKNEKN